MEDGDGDGDPESKEQTGKVKSSRLFKMKKFLATKGAGSCAGRKAVQMYLGPHGADLINIIEATASRTCGKKGASNLTSNILKLSFKAHLLYSEKMITMNDISIFADPINTFVILLYQTLLRVNNPVQREQVKCADQVGPVTLAFCQLAAMMVQVFRDHVKPKNIEMMTRTTDFFGEHAFWELFLGADETKEDRLTFQHHLEHIMRDTLDEHNLRPTAHPCLERGCNDESLRPLGTKFIGSPFCIEHHNFYYQQLQKSPHVTYFLWGPGKIYKPFADLLISNSLKTLSAFMISCRHYRYQTVASVRRIFAEELVSKYFSDKSDYRVHTSTRHWIPEATVTQFKQNALKYEVGLVDEIMRACEVILQPFFINEFVPSAAYKDYISLAKPPSM